MIISSEELYCKLEAEYRISSDSNIYILIALKQGMIEIWSVLRMSKFYYLLIKTNSTFFYQKRIKQDLQNIVYRDCKLPKTSIFYVPIHLAGFIWLKIKTVCSKLFHILKQ